MQLERVRELCDIKTDGKQLYLVRIAGARRVAMFEKNDLDRLYMIDSVTAMRTRIGIDNVLDEVYAIIEVDVPKYAQGTVLTGYRLFKDSLGISGWMGTVYMSKRVAEAEGQRMQKDDFERYKVNEVKVTMISDHQGAVDNALVSIDDTDYRDYVRQIGLSKLTQEEREAILGGKESNG